MGRIREICVQCFHRYPVISLNFKWRWLDKYGAIEITKGKVELCITMFSLGDYREQSRHHDTLQRPTPWGERYNCISHCPLHNHIKMLLGNQRYADQVGFHNTLQVKQFKLNTCTFSRCRGFRIKFVRCQVGIVPHRGTNSLMK